MKVKDLITQNSLQQAEKARDYYLYELCEIALHLLEDAGIEDTDLALEIVAEFDKTNN